MNHQQRALLWLRLAAVAVMGLGGVILAQTPQIGESVGFTVVGPRVFPTIIGLGCLLFGALFLIRVTITPDHDLIGEVTAEEASTDWPTTLVLLAILVGYAAVLWPLGYVMATALFFPLSSHVLGSTHWRRDVLVGLAIGLIVYLTFTRLLGVRLPAGILSGWL
ncbi:tripartite tricarboxylate transporter TctB family protein [Chloroflexus sp.]|uniref:tripartite tricarboxylate transporter TctB family protein n=1 Tax=Chloroflexus sp. TaxID=1904827 RepID=UPI002ACF00F2|nr:tripartite tricarboxylate transporter TctB family protein [Chloroflexus sp.]